MKDYELLKKIIEEEEYTVTYLEKFKRIMKLGSQNARKQEQIFRLYSEVYKRSKENWYIIFNTLTVSDQHIETVFKKDSKIWTNYVRKIDRDTGIAVHGNWRKAVQERRKGNEFHRYFAVVEKGQLSGRLHIHSLHMMKKLPIKATDPNAGTPIPINREIQCIKKYWKYGFSVPICVRFNANDAFGKLGWRYPYKLDDQGIYKPLEIGNVEKVVNYIAKYIEKSYTINNNRKETMLWRVRMSRKIGTEMITKMLEKMDKKQIELMMAIKGRTNLKMLGRQLPNQLVKILATKEYLKRLKIKTPQKLWNIMLDVGIRQSMWKHVVTTIEMRIGFNLPNYGHIQIQSMLETEGSKIKELIREQELKVGYRYLALNNNIYGNGARQK